MIHPLQRIRRIDLKYYIQWIATLGVFLMMVQNGIQIGWPSPNLARFADPNSSLPLTPEEASWVVSTMTFGGAAGSVMGPLANEYIGTRKSLLLSMGILTLEWSALVIADSAGWLYFARIVGGAAMSMSFCSFSIYLGEIAPPESRGTLISMAASGTNVGVLTGTLAESYFPMHWTSLAYLVASLFGVAMFIWLRDTPYHLVKVGDDEGAKKSIGLYNHGREVNKEFDEIKNFVESRLASSSNTSKLDELRNPVVKRALIIVIILFTLPHLAGNLAVMAYMETILIDARSEVIGSKEVVILANACGILSSFLSVRLLDKFGRRSMLMASGVGVAIAMGALGLHFYLLDFGGVDPQSLEWLPVVALTFYPISYAVGYAMIPATILSEIFPESTKSVAACIASLAACLVMFFAAKIYQPMIDLTGHAFMLWIFTAFSLASVPFALFMLPETKGKTFQQIQDDMAKRVKE